MYMCVCVSLTHLFHAGRMPECEQLVLCRLPSYQWACHHCQRCCPWLSRQQLRPLLHLSSSSEMSSHWKHNTERCYNFAQMNRNVIYGQLSSVNLVFNHRSINQEQSINKQMNHSVSQSVNKSNNQSVNQTINQSINQLHKLQATQNW